MSPVVHLAAESFKMTIRLLCILSVFVPLIASPSRLPAAEPEYEVRQVTRGPKHHFFGYIGHVGTVPWNGSGRYLLALRTNLQDRMPGPRDAAEIVLLDTRNGYRERVVDRTLAWNPQQGTMLYWNPNAPETQLFFNDRDPDSGRVFTVLFDLSVGEHGGRVREYRLPDHPVGNSGVAQNGEFFLAINYARLARLRPVTGYPGAWDWTEGETAPTNDGVFKVDVETGESRLLVSYRRLWEELIRDEPGLVEGPLFINHTLCNRDSNRIWFFVRGNFRSKKPKIDVAFTIDADGENLRKQTHIGGHPEWAEGALMIGSAGGRQVYYDTDKREILGPVGPEAAFPDPTGDIALSPDGRLLVNGFGTKVPPLNRYVVFDRLKQTWLTTAPFSRGDLVSGELRVDPAPCWDRTGTQILVSAIAPDDSETRQMFVIDLRTPAVP